jgi:hypothetical protein
LASKLKSLFQGVRLLSEEGFAQLRAKVLQVVIAENLVAVVFIHLARKGRTTKIHDAAEVREGSFTGKLMRSEEVTLSLVNDITREEGLEENSLTATKGVHVSRISKGNEGTSGEGEVSGEVLELLGISPTVLSGTGSESGKK